MEYKAKLNMHMKLGEGGYIYIHDLVEFEGVQVVVKKKNRTAKSVQRVYFNDQEFKKIADAVASWKEELK